MISRQEWFKNRIEDCLNELSRVNEIKDWIEFKRQAYELACELLYATTEWDKYYKGNNK